jgi:deoxycytidylate deaminase/phosphopantetheine adenylyltransferase
MTKALSHDAQAFIPGGYDIFSPDHKSFLSSCIEAAKAEVNATDIVIGLATDEALANKGKYRPFFSYDWRQDDVSEWHSSQDTDCKLLIEEFNPKEVLHSPPLESRYKLAVVSSEYEASRIAKILPFIARKTIFIPPIDIIHTTDIENGLLTGRDTSTCAWRVGATLLRGGEVVGTYHNGGFSADDCISCSKQIDLRSAEEESGQLQPSTVPCDFRHAEQHAAIDAQTGDDLLTTTSPCQECAEAIVDSGIKRVSFLRPYHSIEEPLAFLQTNGVKVRQAGYRPQIKI